MPGEGARCGGRVEATCGVRAGTAGGEAVSGGAVDERHGVGEEERHAWEVRVAEAMGEG